LARAADDPGLLCRVLVQHAFAIWVAHTVDERVANLEEARQLADRVADPALQFLTASRSCNVIEAGDLDGFDVQVACMRELHAVLSQPIMEWTLLFTEVPRAMLEGRFSEAERLATRAFEVSGGTNDGLTIFGGQIALLRYEQGRMHELIAAAQQLGWTHIAVVWVDDDDITATAFALADNRTGDLGTRRVRPARHAADRA
jgi:hypothetical protein